MDPVRVRKFVSRGPAIPRSWTDPHVCGEGRSCLRCHIRRWTDPHVRGEAGSPWRPHPHASVGKAHVSTATTSTGRKHPHARRRHQAVRSGRERHGKTPTRVGKTSPGRPPRRRCRKDPHAGGEDPAGPASLKATRLPLTHFARAVLGDDYSRGEPEAAGRVCGTWRGCRRRGGRALVMPGPWPQPMTV